MSIHGGGPHGSTSSASVAPYPAMDPNQFQPEQVVRMGMRERICESGICGGEEKQK